MPYSQFHSPFTATIPCACFSAHGAENGTSAFASALVHITDAPSVSPSGLSGARDSSYSSFASRPMRQSAPAQYPTQPSPVASQKSGASKRITRLDLRSSAFTAAIVPSAFFSTPNARVRRRTSMFFSSCTMRILRASQNGMFTSRFMK